MPGQGGSRINARRESMLRILTHFVGVAVLFLVPHRAWAQGQLRAGAGKTAVTPDPHKSKVYLAGFGHNRVATGVHDDLYARCLALGIAKETLVVCSIDLIGLFYEDVITIRRAFQQTIPAGPALIVASTHTHGGPDTLGLY